MIRKFLIMPLALALMATWPAAGDGQEQYAGAVTARAPRFLFAQSSGSATPVLLDIPRTPVLMRRIAVKLDGLPLTEALAAISVQAGLTLVYGDGVLPADKRVHLRAEQITVVGALTDVLADVGVDVLFNARGGATLVLRRALEGVLPAAGTITGTVTEAGTGDPIAQAQVNITGTSLGRSTGDDGRYTIAGVPAGVRTITVRRVGYDPQSREVNVTDGATVTADFALAGATTRLAEIVTTVSGGQRRVELGHTLASINADSLMQIAPVMTMSDLLLGRAAGVLSLSNGGRSGQAGAIRVRGLNSFRSEFGGNAPIVVVDGARVEAGQGTGGVSVFGSQYAPYIGGYTGRLSDLDPNEIASVEIVKGPSAATLYGTDAANGVIVITTKRGRAGAARWTAFTEQGIITQRLDYEDQFPAAYYAFGRSTADNSPMRCTLALRATGDCLFDSLSVFNTFTDPATKPFKDSRRQEYGVQLSGGIMQGATYFLSGAYEKEVGPAYMPEIDQQLIRTTQNRAVPDWQIRPNAYTRVNARANFAVPLTQRGSATLAAGFVSNQMRTNDFRLDAAAQTGYRDENDGWSSFGGIFNQRPAYGFPWRGRDVVQRFTGSVATHYSVRDWLTLRGTAGADLSTNSSGNLLRRGEGPYLGALSFINTGFVRINQIDVSRYSLDLGATGTRALSPVLTSKTSVGMQYERRAQRTLFLGASDLPLGGETVAGGNAFAPIEATLGTAIAGGYIEEMVGHRDRLFVTGALRFDGASAFGRDFSVAAYPKASLSWVLMDAERGPRLPAVSSLRLRTAYGQSGVQPGVTDALALVTVETGPTWDAVGTAPAGFLGSGNPNLKPERTRELEAGIDLESWASRLRMELTAYHRTTKDAIVSRPNAPSVGGSRIENIGSVRNRGIEAQLSADLLETNAISAGFTLSGHVNENELLRLGPGVTVRNPTSSGTQQEVGFPLYGYWDRVIESYADANGNGIIEGGEVVFSGPNTTYLGTMFPKREATASPYAKFWGGRVHLSGMLQYRAGAVTPGNPAIVIGCVTSIDICRAVNDISTPLEEQAQAVGMFNFEPLGPVVKPTDYLQLREISAAFTLRASMTRFVKADRAQLVLAGRNVAMLWKAGNVPIEHGEYYTDDRGGVTFTTNQGPPTYWIARLNLTF